MDIVKRLREYETWSEDWPIIKEAADEIERLREALEKITSSGIQDSAVDAWAYCVFVAQSALPKRDTE